VVLAVIIGGSGRMGAWFAEHLFASGYEVLICDKNKPPAGKARRRQISYIGNPTKAAALSKIVLLATPTQTTVKLLSKLSSYASQDTLFVEMSSVKEPLREMIEELTRRGVKILSIHPMYGPGARRLTDKAVLIAQQPSKSKAAKTFLSTLKRRGAKLIYCNLRDHDRIVASTLVLPHLMNFAFVNALKDAGLSLNTARAMGGTTFKLQLLIAEALYHESMHNETSILVDNRHSREVGQALVREVEEIRRKVRKGARSELARQLNNGATYAAKDRLFPTAYARFAAAVEASSRVK
jgi:prephenate dehydrogenase